MNPVLLFENMYETATITASSETAGFLSSNVPRWRVATAYRWKASSLTPPAWVKANQGAGGTLQPDAVVIAGHNLFTLGARFKLQWSTDDAAWTDAFGAVTPASNKPNLQLFTVAGVKRYWRIYIDMAAGNFPSLPQIGSITLGRKLVFTEGVTTDLDPYGEEAETEWNRNEGGTFLGSNFRFLKKSFVMNYDSPGFITAAFYRPGAGLGFETHFLPHARSKPFWFAWNPDVDPQEVYMCQREGRVSMPFVGSTLRRGLQDRFTAYVEP